MVLRHFACLLLFFLGDPISHASNVIAVRLIYLASGKPAVNQPIVFSEGKPSAASTKRIRGVTDQNGIAHFSFSEPQPEVVWIYYDNGQLAGCAKETLLSVAEVIKKGMTIARDDSFTPSRKGSRQTIDRFLAAPGEVVIFVHKLTVWDRLKRY